MSKEQQDPYYHPSLFSSPQGFDISFTECLHGSMDYNSLAKAFGLSPSPSEVVSSIEGNSKPLLEVGISVASGGNGDQAPKVSTPNSSVSFTSSDHQAGGEEDSQVNNKEDAQPTGSEGEESPKKQRRKAKKKMEKKAREPRFAFMTKSVLVDHLEDGYRWRKYGQKALKNSPFPRSYYRCTTEKCNVKKRVERSFQDPTIVITTYEGQHNHPIPSTLKANTSTTAASMATHNFPQEFPLQTPPIGSQVTSGGSIYAQYENPHLHCPDGYGLLQDMLPSMFLNKYP